MKRKPFRVGLLMALLAALAMCAVPAFASAATRTDRSQNKRIAKQAKAIKKTAGAVVTLGKTVKGIDSRVKTIEDAAPQLISGLGQLKDAATALKDGLTQAADGLTKLKTLVTSTEYGFGQVIIVSAGPTQHPQGGSFVETPNVPDDAQQAQTFQQFTAQHTGDIVVAYGVRSNESDGTGASNPAALCKVEVTHGTSVATTAANGDIGGLPFQPVNTKSPVTSTAPANAGFPFGLKTSGADADVTTSFDSGLTATAGDLYTVAMSCVDTTPDPNDPSA